MSTATEIKHIVRDPDFYEGKPCIEGHRISVHDVVLARYFHGFTPEEIVTQAFPSLSLAEVYAALLYYQEHKEEIDREIAEEAAEYEARAAADTSPLAQKTRQLITERKSEQGM